MKKIILGGALALLINYCIGSTYVIYNLMNKKIKYGKVVEKHV